MKNILKNKNKTAVNNKKINNKSDGAILILDAMKGTKHQLDIEQKVNKFNKKLICTSIALITSLTAFTANASVVRSDIDYQYFRDFAENKGQFYVGASNIDIKDRDGAYVGTMLKDIPMIDFSAVNTPSGIAVLLDPQYIVSVRHNGGYQNVSFGSNTKNPDNHTYSYKIVDRNNYNQYDFNWDNDYHLPRLNKLVTEVAPMKTTSDVLGTTNGQNNIDQYFDREKYPLFLVVGSGTQMLQDELVINDKIKIPNSESEIKAVRYGINGLGVNVALTGGEALQPYNKTQYALIVSTADLYNESSPMHAFGLSGDSGSGLFAYDATQKEWVYVGTNAGFLGNNGIPRSWYHVVDKEFHEAMISEDTHEPLDSGEYIWGGVNVGSGTSQLIDNVNNNEIVVDVNTSQYAKHSNAQNTKGNTATQNIKVVEGTKTVNSYSSKLLENNGKNLIFNGNGVLTLNENIDQGAGSLRFNGDYAVNSLDSNITHKGAGVIVSKDAHVTWSLKNPEGDRLSKIGEGVLEINGIGINKGDISVGDGTVILNQQADASGVKQAFNTVGIVSGRSTVVLSDDKQLNANNIYFGYRGGRLDVNGNNIVFNTIQNVDDGAQIVNHSTNKASNITILGEQNPEISAFSGFLGEADNNKNNGELNIAFNPIQSQSILLLNGGSNLDGTLSVNDGGTIILSGRQTPYANGELTINEDITHTNQQSSLGSKYKYNLAAENVYDDDWINRNFIFKNVDVNENSTLEVNRNVSSLTSHVNVKSNGVLNLGVLEGSEIYIRSDTTGVVNKNTLTKEGYESIPSIFLNGNVTLNNEASANVYDKQAVVNGDITNAGSLKLSKSLTGNDIGILTINGNYVGAGGVIHIGTTLATDDSPTDKLVINGNTSGYSRVHVENFGGLGAKTIEGIKIIDVNGMSSAKFELDGRVVAGAYEYFLNKGGITNYTDGDWYLSTQKNQRRPEAASYLANLTASNTMFVSELKDRLVNTQYVSPITNTVKNSTLWTTAKGSQKEFKDDSGNLNTKDKTHVFQIGTDLISNTDNNHNLWRVGTMAGYGSSNSESVSNTTGYKAKGSVKGYNVGLYGTWFENYNQKTGAYLDSTLQYSWFDNTVSGGGLQSESYKSKGLTASLETGYSFNILKQENTNYFLKPKAKLIYQNIKANNFEEINETVLDNTGLNNLQTRIGMEAFMDIYSNKSNVEKNVIPYLEMTWIHNKNKLGVLLDDNLVNQRGGKNSYEVKVGAHGHINQQLSLRGSLDHEFGENSYKKSSLTLGLKYNF